MINSNYLKGDFYQHLKQDEGLFEKIMTSDEHYIFVWDYENQEHLWMSKSILKRLGFKKEYSENDLKFWKLIMNFKITSTEISQKVNTIIDVVFKSSNENTIIMSATLFLIKNEKNKVIRIIGILKKSEFKNAVTGKISKKNKFEKTLLENQNRFKFISENISDGIYIIENEKLVFASGAYLKMMGLTEEEKHQSHNKDMFCMVHQDDLESVKGAIYGAAENKLSSVKYTFRCLTGDGEYKWREDIMNIHYDASGKAFRAITIARDITQDKLKKLEIIKKQESVDLQNQLLIKLYSNAMDSALEGKIKEVTILAAKGLTIEKAGFWEIKNDELVCKNLFNKIEDLHSADEILDVRSIPKYITALNNKKALVVEDAYTDESTIELIDNYLKPLGVTDMLDIPVRANGKFYGVLCCEHRNNPRVWSENDISFARALADYLSLALEEDRRKQAETKLNENQEKLKFISENTSDGILVFESNAMTYVSPAYSKFSGYSEEYMQNLSLENIFSLVHPEDRERLRIIIYSNLGKQTQRFSYEYRFKGSNGEYQWREDSANVIYKADGAYSKYILISRDITERKATERQLVESEQQLRLITENTSDGVLVIESGKLSYVSPSYVKLLNYPKEIYLNFTPEDIYNRFHPDDILAVQPFILECLSKHMKEFKYEFRFRAANGDYHWREDSANVIYDENGNYSKYIVVTRDVSARKEAEKEKNRLFQITEKQNEKLINFTHIVSHDIRSHTSNLSMILDLFEETNDSEEQKEYFNMLKQSTDKLSDTIFFLNETVAIQSGVKGEKVKLNLKKEIEKAILGINAIVKTNKVSLKINIDEALEIEGTQSYLESIIFNLLTNAIKYKSPDRNPIIKITAKREEDEIKLSVQDNGIGIDLELHKDKIFGMYKTFHGNPDAVGLGLFMMKNHIESMGGSIDVESEVGVGTTFNLYFI
ncbi:PAS domain-containing protein [Flavobacterium sp.]|uniref:PAS domain-containing protein n=1 Tax=Flavobacterium sp. TaxID=239 RepID=UPI003D6C6894